MTQDKMVGWHYRLNGRKFEQAPGDGEGQRSLALQADSEPPGKTLSPILIIIYSLNTYLKTSKIIFLLFFSIDPMDCSPLGFSVRWIFQARILEWTAIPFSRGSF